MSTWKPIEHLRDEDTDVFSFPIGAGTATGGPLYRFLAYVPVGASESLVLAAIGAWGLPIRLITHPLPDDWPQDDRRLVIEEALKRGQLVSNEMPGPDYRAVRGEFVGQAQRFATKVPFEEGTNPRSMFPYQVWKGPDVRFGRPDAPPPSKPGVKPPSNPPVAAAEQPAGGVGWLWVGLGALGAAGAIWWLRRSRPALPARRLRPA